MKKIISLFVAMILATGLVTGCGSKTAEGTDDSKKLTIVTTIFPEYDWVKNILGDNPAKAEVTMLLDNGVDLHSYQPTAEDIMKISSCDMFVYVGGESDEWVEDALKEATNKDMIVINLLESLGDSVKEEEIVEGMQEEEHHHEDGDEDEHEHDEDEDEHDHEHDHEHEEEETEYDEHVWLSLKNAVAVTETLSAKISSLDPANSDIYKANTEAYVSKLKDLDNRYEEAVSESPVKTLLFGDRFPFRYLTDDYGLKYYAAFVGCSAETEASFETITFLSSKADELSLNAVMTIEGADHRIAETIVDNTASKDLKILTMDSMQSTTSKDVSEGASYYSIMESNLATLKEALK
ncbi:MAG: metal ABC transporter substrate-binding protein [Lachnospiraceae bacterium]|nr:metal ABC transporter substrate-binding protein [Lachnospiraceae bacterium]